MDSVTYEGEVLRVVDGDTVQCRLKLGLGVELRHTIRLAGVNAPELTTFDGQRAKEWLSERACPGERCTVASLGRDKYGRVVATVVLATGFDLVEELIASGHGVRRVMCQEDFFE